MSSLSTFPCCGLQESQKLDLHFKEALSLPLELQRRSDARICLSYLIRFSGSGDKMLSAFWLSHQLTGVFLPHLLAIRRLRQTRVVIPIP
jgi:hypothetical protein